MNFSFSFYLRECGFCVILATSRLTFIFNVFISLYVPRMLFIKLGPLKFDSVFPIINQNQLVWHFVPLWSPPSVSSPLPPLKPSTPPFLAGAILPPRPAPRISWCGRRYKCSGAQGDTPMHSTAPPRKKIRWTRWKETWKPSRTHSKRWVGRHH